MHLAELSLADSLFKRAEHRDQFECTIAMRAQRLSLRAGALC
jgi:hypothetical protein